MENYKQPYFDRPHGSSMTGPKIISAEFCLSVCHPWQLPGDGLPEVAFLGRSNVGKSSLINALLGRRKLVRTSATPGCTRALNFFLINSRWYFVDLPGFGYAAVSRQIKDSWGRLVMDYLAGRENLAAVVFLQDGRRLPGPEELFLWESLRDRGHLAIMVLTKADKLKTAERSRQFKDITKAFAPMGAVPEGFLWFSATTGEGRGQLWGRIMACLQAREGPG